MRVLFVAGREASYTRNAVLLRALELAGCEVSSITSDAPTYAHRFPSVTWRLVRERLGREGEPDLYLVGFLGHPLVTFLRRLTRRPIVFDPFVSLYETLCEDRGRVRPGSRTANLILGLDRAACRCADLLLGDTRVHIDYFSSISGLPEDRFLRVWVGADDRVYYPMGTVSEVGGSKQREVRVLYYSTFQPLHGVEVVLTAAEMLLDRDDIRIHLVGRGPELPRLKSRLRDLIRRGALAWDPWVEERKLARLINEADICLGGHFADTPKAGRVIPGKIYQFMAVGKPIIVGDNAANRELLTPDRNAVFVPPGDPPSLAIAVRRLADDTNRRERLGNSARELFMSRCSPAALAEVLLPVLEKLAGCARKQGAKCRSSRKGMRGESANEMDDSNLRHGRGLS